MKKNNTLNSSRRRFFKTSLGVAGAMAASNAYAQVCATTAETGAQPLGPFFPRPGTPTVPVREDSNPETPIFLANDNDLTFVEGQNGTAKGQQVVIEGKLVDQECQPIPGATIIIWQASSTGRYNHNGDASNEDFQDPRNGNWISREIDPSFQFWGKTITNAEGDYVFKTIVPGFYPANLESGWYRPPHIHFMVSSTGREQFITQMYFRSSLIKDNEWIQELNQRDFLLQNPELTPEQKQQLIVDFSENPEGAELPLIGRFDIKMR